MQFHLFLEYEVFPSSYAFLSPRALVAPTPATVTHVAEVAFWRGLPMDNYGILEVYTGEAPTIEYVFLFGTK
jgi:hypothetical protein